MIAISTRVKPVTVTVLTMILVGILLILMVPSPVKGNPVPMVQYTIEQNGNVTTVIPISSSGNVTAFYGYDTVKTASAYTGLEESETSVLFLYEDEGTGDLSLVFIHDIYNDDSGGQIVWEFSGIPSGAEFVVQDDDDTPQYNDGPYLVTSGNATVLWTWSPCCTDGGALSPLTSPFAITINPSFINGINNWDFLSDNIASPSVIPLDLEMLITITAQEVDEIEIDIDIKPGSYPNSINPNSKGVIPVAILTTDDFDASSADPETVVFGPLEASAVHYAMEDVDEDGDLDMILHFRTQEVGLAEGDTEAILTGQTTDGIEIIGTDSVRIVPPEGKGNPAGKPNPKANPEAPGQNKLPGEPATGKGKAKGKADAPGQNK